MAETKNLTIMFTDIKGFTTATSAKKRDEFEKFLDLHEQLVVPVFKKHKGRIVKTIGDAFMVIFHSPTNAVLCGMEIQDVLKKYNENPVTEEKVEVRVAINSGEVHIRKNDVFGEPVNIASRIEGIADAGDIYFTESVYLSMNKREIPSAEVGYRKLKGLPEEIKVYKVLREGEHKKRHKPVKGAQVSSGEISGIRRFWKKRKGWIIAAAIILIFIAIVANPRNIVKKEQNVDQFITQAENAINSGNYESARTMANRLEKIPEDEIPPKLALEGAKLYVFLRQPDDAVHMIQIAKDNLPTKEESEQIDSFVQGVMENLSPEQQQKVKDMLAS